MHEPSKNFVLQGVVPKKPRQPADQKLEPRRPRCCNGVQVHWVVRISLDELAYL